MQTDDQRIMGLLNSPDFNYFCKSNNIRLALLFGSRVTGKAREESDFDLAILLEYNHRMDPLTAGELKRSLLHEIIKYLDSSRVDLTILNEASSYLKYEIAQTGKVLFEAENGVYAKYVSLAIRKLSDDRLFREAEKKYLGMQVQ